MNQIITNNLQQIVGLGNPKSKICFHLPNAPIVGEMGYKIDDLVAINGNHWRKIFVIIAKLCSDNISWQQYRSEDLINEVYINFENKLNEHAICQYICGKNHSESFELNNDHQQWEIINHAYDVNYHKTTTGRHIILTPYLDYRQFPNLLIEEVRNYLLGDCSSDSSGTKVS